MAMNRVVAVCVASMLALPACKSSSSKPREAPVAASTATLTVTAEEFSAMGAIPKALTCEGSDTPPTLSWSGAPEATKSFVLVVDDPDAPDPAAPKMTWVHWVVYDIPGTVTSIAGAAIPEGARAGTNSWKRTGYGGPCPPVGKHRYFHKVFALDATLGDLGAPTAEKLEAAM